MFCNKTGCTAREICVDMQNSLCQPSLSRRDLPSVVRQTTPPPPPATDVTKTVQFTKSGDLGGGGEFTSAITNLSDPTASIIPPPPTPHSPSLGPDYSASYGPGGGWRWGDKGFIALVVGGVFFGVAVVVIILMRRRIKRGRTGMGSGGVEGVNGVGGVGGEKYPVDTSPGELEGPRTAAVEIGGAADSGAEIPEGGGAPQPVSGV